MSRGRHRRPVAPARYGRGAMAAAAGVIGTTAGMMLTVEPASAAVVSDATIATAAKDAGLAGCHGVSAGGWVAVALAESSGNATAHATSGEDSRGLWQINVRSHPALASSNLYDPTANARAAKRICDGAGPGAWTVYSSGAYRRFLARGEAAAGALVVVPASTARPAMPTMPASRTTTRTPLAANLSTAMAHQVRGDVRQVQLRLRDLGYPITADGVFGPRTSHTVRDYQSRHGLAADGVVGPRTWASLFG